ncbi:MAG: sugar phosphate nucleotidyltransferase [Candidatus Micrarchaeia archaeon]
MKQEKIAISIDPQLLREVERTIDGKEVRSRSQAIELLLRKALRGNVTTAVILAGGPKGEEKAMRLHNGHPVLQSLIKWMAQYGINRFIITLDSKEQRIREYFGDGSRFNVKIYYLLEQKPSGTAGALHGCRQLVGLTFIVANADSLFGFDLPSMVLQHERSGKVATIAVRESSLASEYGTVEMEGNDILGFHEKTKKSRSNIISTGLYVMGADIFEYLPVIGSLERDVFPLLASQGRLGGFVFTSEWKDVERLK